MDEKNHNISDDQGVGEVKDPSCHKVKEQDKINTEKQPHNPEEEDFMVNFLKYVYQHRIVLLTVFFIIFIGGAIYTFTAPPFFEAVATFFFPSASSGSGLLGSLGIGGGGSISNYAVSILQSNLVSQAVIDKFGDKLFDEKWAKKATRVEKLKEIPHLIEVSLDANRVITVRVETRDPQLSADVANFYVEKYTQFAQGAVLSSAKQYRIHIQEQRDKVKKELERDEAKLLAFQESKDVLEPQTELKALMDFYAQIKGMSIVSQVNAEESLTRLNSIKSKIMERQEMSIRDLKLPPSIESPEVQSIYNEIVLKEMSLAKDMQTMTEDNPKIETSRQELESLRGLLKDRLTSYLQGIDNDTDPLLINTYAETLAQQAKSKALNNVISNIEKKFEEIPDLSFSFRRLQRDVLIREKIYALLEMELQKALGEEAKSEAEIQILDRAVPPDIRSRPVYRVYLIVFGLLGLFMAFLIAWIGDKLSIAIRQIKKREV